MLIFFFFCRRGSAKTCSGIVDIAEQECSLGLNASLTSSVLGRDTPYMIYGLSVSGELRSAHGHSVLYLLQWFSVMLFKLSS